MNYIDEDVDRIRTLRECLIGKWKQITNIKILSDTIVSTTYICKLEDEDIFIKLSYYDDIDDFMNEVNNQKVSASLGYSPKILDHFKCNDVYIIIMEYLNGKSYTNLLMQRTSLFYRIKVRVLMKIFIMMLDLLLLHNISHRDLHTENIIVSPGINDIDVKIIDFGFSKNVKDRTFIYKKREYDNMFKHINTLVNTDRQTKLKTKQLLNMIYNELYNSTSERDDINITNLEDTVRDVFTQELLKVNIGNGDLDYIIM